MAARHELLHRAETEYERFKAAVDGLEDDGVSRRWLGSWGVYEIVAHLIGWHREMVPALEALGRGERPYPAGAYDDLDRWNVRFVEAHQAFTSFDALLGELETSHRELMTAASRLSAEHFADGQAASGLVEGVTTAHYREHADQIGHWRLLRTLNARFIHNFVTNDVKSHDALTHKDFVCITASGRRENKTAYLKRWATGFDPRVITYWDYRDESITLLGPIALVRAVNKHVVVRDGTETVGMTMYTDTYVHENGTWTCVQAQLTPVSPEYYPGDDTIVRKYIRGRICE